MCEFPRLQDLNARIRVEGIGADSSCRLGFSMSEASKGWRTCHTLAESPVCTRAFHMEGSENGGGPGFWDAWGL